MSLEQDDVTLSGQDRPGRWAFVSKWRLPMSNFRLFWRQISWYRMHFRSWNVQWVTSLNINFLLVMTSVFSFNAISKWTKPLHVFWNSKPSQYGFNFQHLKAKYGTQKPSTCRATLFRCKFLSMFPVFHLVWSNCRATKTFVAGWRKLLRKVERGSTLNNKFWFFIKLQLLLDPHQANQPIRALHFFNPQQICFVARPCARDKLIT